MAVVLEKTHKERYFKKHKKALISELHNIIRANDGKFRQGQRKLLLFDRRGKPTEILVNLREDSIFYIDKSSNRKTDNIPQQVIGRDREESLATCQGCKLLEDKTCYSQFGTPACGFAATRKAAVERGKDKSIENALRNRHKSAKMFRMGGIGDPGSIAPDVYLKHDAMARAEGLGVLSYTHQWHWQHASFLRGKALASCDTWKDVVDSTNDGWRAAFHVDKDETIFNGKSIKDAPQGEVDGINYFLCPAQRKEHLGGREAHCNDCGLCDGQKMSKVDAIVFIQHGSCMKMKKEREAKQNLIQLEW